MLSRASGLQEHPVLWLMLHPQQDEGTCELHSVKDELQFVRLRLFQGVRAFVPDAHCPSAILPLRNSSLKIDIGSIVQQTGDFVRFFNPRTDHWSAHFVLDGIIIVACSDIGEVTARILDFNNEERLFERQTLQAIGRYPSAAAIVRMNKRT